MTEAEALDRRWVGLEERFAAKAAGLDAKVITYEDPPALPAPKRKRANVILEAADTAVAPTTARYRKARRDQDVPRTGQVAPGANETPGGAGQVA